MSGNWEIIMKLMIQMTIYLIDLQQLSQEEYQQLDQAVDQQQDQDVDQAGDQVSYHNSLFKYHVHSIGKLHLRGRLSLPLFLFLLWSLLLIAAIIFIDIEAINDIYI